MERLADTALIGGERADATDHSVAGIRRLSSEIQEASSYLPAYDQKTYTEAIKALEEKLDQIRATFAPRPKFAFKSSRKNPSAISLSDAAEIAEENRRHVPGYLSPGSSSVQSSLVPTPQQSNTPPIDEAAPNNTSTADNAKTDDQQPSPKPTNETSNTTTSTSPPRPSLPKPNSSTISISHQTSTHILLPSTPSRPSLPATLSHLSHCVIDTSFHSPSSSSLSHPPFASLTIKSAHSSLLLAAPVDGPTHITSVTDSVLVLVRTGQLRMHGCKNVKRSSSDPAQIDLWDQIDDFNNPSQSSQQPTPTNPPQTQPQSAHARKNWRTMQPQELVPEEVWTEVVPGGPGWSLEDILRAVGVPF
ncbi:MAG: hypothetical protein Q9227_006837 [Pyrenula ochraceoflavens]